MAKLNKVARSVAVVILVTLFVLANVSCGGTGSPRPTPTPEVVAQPTVPVFLNPKSQHASPGSEVTVNVEVMPAGWGVSAGEIGLSFDASALEAVKVTPGSLLGANPLLGTQKLDNTAGTVTYALARAGATTAPGARAVLATVTFKVGPTARGTLNVGIAKVGLTDEKLQEIKGLQTQGGTIIVD